MDRQYWTSPVELYLPGSTRCRAITGTIFALECLVTLWPTTRGNAYLQALKDCRDALGGQSSVEQARSSFISAAREANLTVASA